MAINTQIFTDVITHNINNIIETYKIKSQEAENIFIKKNEEMTKINNVLDKGMSLDMLFKNRGIIKERYDLNIAKNKLNKDVIKKINEQKRCVLKIKYLERLTNTLSKYKEDENAKTIYEIIDTISLDDLKKLKLMFQTFFLVLQKDLCFKGSYDNSKDLEEQLKNRIPHYEALITNAKNQVLEFRKKYPNISYGDLYIPFMDTYMNPFRSHNVELGDYELEKIRIDNQFNQERTADIFIMLIKNMINNKQFIRICNNKKIKDIRKDYTFINKCLEYYNIKI